jgi:hypothetical protein
MKNILNSTYIQTSSYDNYDGMAKMLHGSFSYDRACEYVVG